MYIKILTDFDPCSSRRVNNNNHHFLNVHVHICTIILWLFTNLSQNIYCTQSSGNIYISDQRIRRVPSQWVCFRMSRPRQGYAVWRTVGALAAMTLRREGVDATLKRMHRCVWFYMYLGVNAVHTWRFRLEPVSTIQASFTLQNVPPYMYCSVKWVMLNAWFWPDIKDTYMYDENTNNKHRHWFMCYVHVHHCLHLQCFIVVHLWTLMTSCWWDFRPPTINIWFNFTLHRRVYNTAYMYIRVYMQYFFIMMQ